jgi:protein SCO1/2
MKKTLALLAALLLTGYLVASRAWVPARDVADFTLQGPAGPVALHDLRGQVLLLYFGYLTCPDICPTSLSDAAKAMAKLSPAEAERVRLLFVSVDPERDTAEATDRYARFFHPRFAGATGKPAELDAAIRLFGGHYAKVPVDSSLGYAVDHTADIYVLAPGGRLAATVPHGAPPEDIARAIRSAR